MLDVKELWVLLTSLAWVRMRPRKLKSTILWVGALTQRLNGQLLVLVVLAIQATAAPYRTAMAVTCSISGIRPSLSIAPINLCLSQCIQSAPFTRRRATHARIRGL